MHHKDGIIKYDPIAAQRRDTTSEQQTTIDKKLNESSIKNSMPIRYEHVSMNAVERNAKQDITVIATSPEPDIDSCVRIQDQVNHTPLMLKCKGTVISKRLAKLTGQGVGDDIIVYDGAGNKHAVPITGVCEMYIGHFLFMGPQAYQKIFHDEYSTNARMIELKDRSSSNARHEAAEFMRTSGITAVAQNSMLINQTQVLANALTIISLVTFVLGSIRDPASTACHNMLRALQTRE